MKPMNNHKWHQRTCLKRILPCVLGVGLLLTALPVLAKDLAAGPFTLAQAGRQILVNDVPLSLPQIQQLEQKYRVQIQNGAYWYDKRSGIWGLKGGPGLGLLPANLAIGGPLKANASAGNTGVFINGRQLHRNDLILLQQLLGRVPPGRYWLDANGNAGNEGGPVRVNLLQLARNAGGGGFYRNSYTGIGAGSDGNHGYVMGKDWSVSY